MRRTVLGLAIATMALGALSCTTEGPSGSRNLPAYLTSDTCRAYPEQGSCEAAPEGTCAWVTMEADCAPGAACSAGACAALDPCNAYDNQVSCLADVSNGCSWAAVDRLCPAGADDCGPCECTCSGSSGGSAGTGTASCACPACEPGTECPPCECEVPGVTEDPCLAWVNEADCVADETNSCSWIAMTVDCDPSSPDCRSGLCQGVFYDEDCACLCPSCMPGEDCPPCICDCGGGDPDCVPGGGGDEPVEPPSEPR
ncbi:MAG: hypothetical protein RBU30_14245 [Polyangia bacterium]|jgi:hypothetical protein|nr:hypothetical protein [Polyangia bacterium]